MVLRNKKYIQYQLHLISSQLSLVFRMTNIKILDPCLIPDGVMNVVTLKRKLPKNRRILPEPFTVLQKRVLSRKQEPVKLLEFHLKILSKKIEIKTKKLTFFSKTVAPRSRFRPINILRNCFR